MIEAGKLPTLKRLMESGEYFSSAFSNLPWTLPSPVLEEGTEL